MEGGGFNFKFVIKLETRGKEVNERKVSAYIKPPDWLRNKNATINPKNIDNRCF